MHECWHSQFQSVIYRIIFYVCSDDEVIGFFKTFHGEWAISIGQSARKNSNYKRQKQPLEVFFNPNKAGLFEGSIFWGGGGDGRVSLTQKNLSNINMTLYNC